MKLQSFEVRHFRSVESATLAECGGFNVLIGKNNSGKSTVLSAVSAFFECLASGNVVSTHPEIGKALDFHNKDESRPIEIELRFRLNREERDEIVQKISEEAPRVKNAAADIPSELVLTVVLTVTSKPAPFGYVSSMSVSNATKHDPGLGTDESSILKIDHKVAIEIYERTSRHEQLQADLEVLSQVEGQIEDTWAMIRRDRDLEGRSSVRAASRSPLRYLLPTTTGVRSSVDLQRELQAVVNRASSEEDFSRSDRRNRYQSTERVVHDRKRAFTGTGAHVCWQRK